MEKTLSRPITSLITGLAVVWASIVLGRMACLYNLHTTMGECLLCGVLVAVTGVALFCLQGRLARIGYANFLWILGLATASFFLGKWSNSLWLWATYASPGLTTSTQWWAIYLRDIAPFFARLVAEIVLVMLLGRFLVRRTWGTAILWGLAVGTVTLLALRADGKDRLEAGLFLVWLFLAGHAGAWLVRRTLGLEIPWYLGVLALYALLSLVLLALGQLNWFLPPVLLGIVLVIATAGICRIAFERAKLGTTFKDWSANQGPVEACYYTVLWVCAAVAFINACAPETISDAKRVYVPFMMRLLREGGLHAQPLGWGQLMLPCSKTFFAMWFGLSGEVGAKWLAFSASLLIGFGLHDELRRLGITRSQALAATLLLVGSPYIVLFSSTCYYDILLTAMTLAGVQCLRRALTEPDLAARAGCLAALFLGTALSIKHTSFIIGVVLIPFAFIACGASWRRAMVTLVSVGFSALMVAAPWYALVYAWTGNPVYPLLNHYFQSPYWPVDYDFTKMYGNLFGYDSWSAYWILPWSITFHTDRVAEATPGALGIVLLLFFPTLFWVRKSTAIGYLILAVGFILVVSKTVLYVRYWFQVLPFLVIAMAEGWKVISSRLGAPTTVPARLGIALALGLLVLVQLPLGLKCNWGVNPGLALEYYRGRESLGQFLTKAIAPYEVFQEMNQDIQPGESVIALEYQSLSQIKSPVYLVEAMIQHQLKHDNESWYDKLIHEKNARFILVNNRVAGLVRAFQIMGMRKFMTIDNLCASTGDLQVYDIKHTRWQEQDFLSRTVLFQPNGTHQEAGNGVVPSAGVPTKTTNESPLNQDILLPTGANRIRIVMEGISASKVTSLLTVIWYNQDGKEIKREVDTNLLLPQVRTEMIYAAKVPPAASRLVVFLSPWPRGEFECENGRIDLAK